MGTRLEQDAQAEYVRSPSISSKLHLPRVSLVLIIFTHDFSARHVRHWSLPSRLSSLGCNPQKPPAL